LVIRSGREEMGTGFTDRFSDEEALRHWIGLTPLDNTI